MSNKRKHCTWRERAYLRTLTLLGISLKSFSFFFGMITWWIPARWAANTFSLIPPTCTEVQSKSLGGQYQQYKTFADTIKSWNPWKYCPWKYCPWKYCPWIFISIWYSPSCNIIFLGIVWTAITFISVKKDYSKSLFPQMSTRWYKHKSFFHQIFCSILYSFLCSAFIIPYLLFTGL